MRKRQGLWFSVMLALLLATVSNAKAQTATGQITGTVKDASGAILANAKVTVTNEATSFSRETSTTEGTGTYVFPLLPVGNYTVARHTTRLQHFQTNRSATNGRQNRPRRFRSESRRCQRHD